MLLSAWISQQETTYMAAAPMTGSALPEGATEHTSVTNKGHQQVTAWQVRAPPSPSEASAIPAQCQAEQHCCEDVHTAHKA